MCVCILIWSRVIYNVYSDRESKANAVYRAVVFNSAGYVDLVGKKRTISKAACSSMIGYRHDIVVRVSVCPSVCDAVHCGARGRCRELKVVPWCPSRALPIHCTEFLL